MNFSSSYHPSTHESGDNSRRIAYSSSASPSVGELEAKIASLKILRVRMGMASEDISPSTELYKAKDDKTAAADSNANAIEVQGSDVNMQALRIPSKSENCKPPVLDPASCASVLAQVGGGAEGSYPSAILTGPTSTADADSKEGGFDVKMPVLRIPTKSKDCPPGPVLNPASCASGLALLVGDGEISDLSLNAFVERINDIQGNSRGRSSSIPNEDWEDFHSNDLRLRSSSLGSLFLGDEDN